jgi:predicted MFS family arabinose efflux permease
VVRHLVTLVGPIGSGKSSVEELNRRRVCLGVSVVRVKLSFVDLAVYPLGVRAATVRASEASGWVLGAIALAGALGSVLAGVLAEWFGFNSINRMAAVAGFGAVILIVVAQRHQPTRPNVKSQVETP